MTPPAGTAVTCPVPDCQGHQDGTLTDWLSQHQLGTLATTTILRLCQRPAEVWMVRDLGYCASECAGNLVAVFATEAEAQAMVHRLGHTRTLTVERWEVPGHE